MNYPQYRRMRRMVHECCNYDGGNCFAVFKNVFNDYYAKDTSKKIRAVVKMRGEAGEHIASNPPYGYVKDPQNKKKWIVDEESAKVVRRIFDLCIAGKGPMQIAKVLTADRVLTVTAYNARQKGWVMPDNLYQWCSKSVAGILERPEYTGCTVNFKTYTKSLKFKKRMKTQKKTSGYLKIRSRQSLNGDSGNGCRR